MQTLQQPIPQAGVPTVPQHPMLVAHRRRDTQNQQQLHHHVLLLQTPAQNTQGRLQGERAGAGSDPIRQPLHRRRKAFENRNGKAEQSGKQLVQRVREEGARDRAVQPGVFLEYSQ